MIEYVKKADVLEIMNAPLPRDIAWDYIYDLKGVWLDEDEADTPQTNRTTGATTEPLTEQPQTEDYDFRDEQEYNDRWDCPWK